MAHISTVQSQAQNMVHDEIVVNCPKRYGKNVAELIADAFKRAAAEVMHKVEMTSKNSTYQQVDEVITKMKKDLLGKVFGKLTVESFAGLHKSNPMWSCKCSCGNCTTVRGDI